MKVLVANLGSTSFKYRLFDMADGEKLLARGGVDRIGSAESKAKKACTCSNVTAWKRKGDTIKMVSPGKGGTIKMVSPGKGGTIKMVSPQGDGTSFNDDVGGAT